MEKPCKPSSKMPKDSLYSNSINPHHPIYDEFTNVGTYPFYFEDKSKYIDRIHETINTVLHKDLGRLFNIQPDKRETYFASMVSPR